jgi:fatty acid desaturase
VRAMRARMSTLPDAQLRRNRHFYVIYDSAYAALAAGALTTMSWGGTPLLLPDWAPWMLLALPAACYLQILASVFIHNASHANFSPWLNRFVGEICGVIVLTRFASWQIVHQRHHRYADDRVKDPHPVEPSYWRYVVTSITRVEQQLQANFIEAHGESRENRAYERRRALLSYTTNVLLVAVWYRCLGAGGFFGLFVPASILGALHIIHFNWTTHGGLKTVADYRPVNLDHGLFRLGNRLFCGIYMHANHHHNPRRFNPARLELRARRAAGGGDADRVA